MVWRNNSLQRRLNDFLRRRRNYIEGNLEAVGNVLERTREKIDVVLQADAFAGLDEVVATYTAEIRVVKDQIRELRALLDEVNVREAFHLVVKVVKAD